MGCIAKMLHALHGGLNKVMSSYPYDPEQPKPELKSDTSTFRLYYLRQMDHLRECPTCSTIRIVVIGLACFGLYSVFF